MCLGKLPLGVGGVLNSGSSPLKAGAMGVVGLAAKKIFGKKNKPSAAAPTSASFGAGG